MSSSAATTGTTPAAIGSHAHRQVRFAVIRRPAVRTATAYISSTKREQQRQRADHPADDQGDGGELDRRPHARHDDLARPAQLGDGGDGRRDGQQDGEHERRG